MAYAVEILERRLLLTTVIVNTIADSTDSAGSGVVSLRDAIAAANSSASPTAITFDPTVFAAAQTIALNGSELELSNTSEPITITGPAAGVTVSAGGQSMVLQVDSAVTATISSVNIIDGFTSNNTSAGQDGSGIYNSGNLTFSNANVLGNTIQSNGSGEGTGVGIYNAGTVNLTNVGLSDNTLSSTTLGGSGAGLYNGAFATLTNVTVSGNSITGQYTYGGGVMNVGTATITNTTVSNNSGGGIYNGGTATIDGTTVFNNTNSGAKTGGGGISNDGTASLTNDTIAGNTMSNGSGGGIYNDPFGNITLSNVTVAGGNTATGGRGGGIANLALAGDFSIGNTIVAGNSAGNQGPDAFGSFDSLGNNLIGKTDASNGWVSADLTGTTATPLNPDLGTLANNGGPTLTMLPLPGSPAIDAGSNGLVPGGITTDQRGFARVSNGIVDIGAVEIWQLTPAAAQIATTGQSSLFSLGSFTQTLASQYSVDVNWGDGSADSVFSMAAAGTIPQQSHTFTASGNYVVNETVTDSDNNISNTAAFDINVINAVNSWTNVAGGDWDDPSNWSLGHVPTAYESARINLAGNYTITHSQAVSDSVNSITSSQPITLSAGTLNVATTFSLNGAFLTLAGGTINGGTISGTGGAQLIATSSGGTLNGVTLDANLGLTSTSANVHVVNGLTLNGTATLGYDAAIFFDSGSQTLGGSGTVVFTNNACEGLIANANNMTLTIGPGISIQGGNNEGANTIYGAIIGFGAINSYSGFGLGGGSNTSVINEGTIDPNVAGLSIVVNPSGSFINQGTIEATNGAGLYLDGTMAGLGTFNAVGGTVALTGTLNNTGTTLPLTAASGSLTLWGGAINGGTVSGTGGAQLIGTGSGGTLNGVTLDTNLNLTSGGTEVHVLNGLTLNGTATLGYDAAVFFDSGSQTLGGSGTVVFTNNACEGLIANANNMTLTIGPGISIQGGNNEGANTIYGAIIGFGAINSYSGFGLGGGSNTSVINEGTIDPNVAGLSIVVNPSGSFINQGTIEATNGAGLYLDGTMAGLGTFNAVGGTVALTGTLNNTGTTLPLTAASGSLTLWGGAINGGTVSGTGGAQLIGTGSGGTLNGVTLDTNLNLTSGGTEVHVLNGLTLNGTATLGYDAAVFFDSGSQTLGGSGTVVFTNNACEGLIANANNMTLTIGPGISIQGGNNEGANTIYGAIIGFGAINSYSGFGLGGGSNTSVINEGTIDPNVAGLSIVVNPSGSFINQGTIEATNGAGLYLDGTMAGLGTFNAVGGTVALTGTLNNTGTTLPLTAASGSLTLWGGAINGGTVSGTGGAQLIGTGSGGTLNGVTLDTNLNLTSGGTEVHVLNGLTLNGTATLGYDAAIFFDSGSQTLGGNGTVVFTNNSTEGLIANANNMTLTIGSGITIQGGNNDGANTIYGAIIGFGAINSYSGFGLGGGSNTSVINEGTIDTNVSGMSIVINPNGNGTFTSDGVLELTNGAASLSINGATSVNGSGTIAGIGTNTFTFTGNLTGNTTNAVGYSPLDTVQLNGIGTATSPQLLEAMGDDMGAVAAGYANNFAYGALDVGSNDYVQLVDQSHNSTGTGAEAVYCVSLNVPIGSTLDLNGLHLYAGSANVQGTILNGIVTLTGLPPAVAAVTGNGQAIADQSATSSTANGTNFGTVAQNSAEVYQTYTIINNGIATLQIGGVNVPAGFSLVSSPPGSIPAYSSATFTVGMPTGTAGTFGGYVTFGTNDSNNNPYSFEITGTVNPAEPVAGVNFNGNPVSDGSSTATGTNGTDFGSVPQDGTPVVRTFTITNTGNVPMTLGSIGIPAGYSLLQSPASIVAAGGSTNFTLGLGTTAPGTFAGMVSFPTSDPYNNPYWFDIAGSITAAAAPLTAVSYNGQPIAENSTATSASIGTDFGVSRQNGAPVERTFTIYNTGDATLSLGNMIVPAGFSLIGTPATSVAAGGSTNFTIGLPTTNAGTFSGNVSFTSNDANNTPFVFAITGKVIVYNAPYIVLSGPSNQTANAGQSASFPMGSFTQANATGPFTVTVNWGDGSANTILTVAAAGTIPAQSHTYAAGGFETATITVTDSTNDASNSATFGVTVAPGAATITVTPPANQTETPGQNSFFSLGNFTEQNGVGPYSVTVNWGDGSAQGVYAVQNAGAIPPAAHTFTNSGIDAVTITVTDAAGHTSNSAIFDVNVATTTIALTPPANQMAIAGESAAFALGSFTQSNSTGPFVVTVNWGDGGSESIFSVASAGTLPSTAHTFTGGSGIKAVTLTVMDSANHTSNSASFDVAVQAATATAVTSNSSSSSFGQPVTFTATITPVSGGGETGSVQFQIDGADVGSPVTVSNGTATYATSSLTAGSHSVSAVYSGDASFAASTSPTFTQSVSDAVTTTAVTSSNDSSANGQPVTFTATVTPATGSGETGTVQFMDGSTDLGSPSTLGTNGTATYTTSALSVGSHSIIAVYSGDNNFAGGTSPIFTQNVTSPVPGWLAPASGATWNPSTHTLTVTGPSTIIADPGPDEPIVVDNSGATLTIAPTMPDVDIHLGGIVLSNGSELDMVSVGAGRTHNNHNTLVIGTLGAASDPTISVDASSKIDLDDNDMIVHTGTSDTTGQAELATIQALAATGRNVAPGGVFDGTWDGNGLTSSAAASVDAGLGYEQNVLAVEDLSDMFLGVPNNQWVVGNATENLGANDIIVKYTYNGDLALDGAVDGNAATIFSSYFANNAGVPATDYAFGDLNGDGSINGNDATIFSSLFGNGLPGSGLPQL